MPRPPSVGPPHRRRAQGGSAHASSPRARGARSRTSPTSRTARGSTAATSRRLAAAGALAALAGHRHAAVWDVAGVERLPPIAGRQRHSRKRSPPCRAHRRPGHRRRLPRAPPDARPPSAGAAARAAGRAAARHRRRDRARAARPHRAYRRHRHRPAAPDTASGVVFVTLEDETGRDQRHRLARPLRPAAPRAAGVAKLMAVYGKRRARRRRRPPDRRPARRPLPAAGFAAHPVAGLPLTHRATLPVPPGPRPRVRLACRSVRGTVPLLTQGRDGSGNWGQVRFFGTDAA